MRALVVDDEPLARRRLIRLLAKVEGVEVCGEAADGAEARERIRALSPDVVFLDIRMPGLSGIDLALQDTDLPPIVFTTAYSEHAVEAFRAQALDYLLKPIELERLREAVDKVRQQGSQAPDRIAEAVRRALGPTEPVRITAQRGDSIHVFDATQIARFRAEEKYTFFRAEGHEYLTEESLQSLHERLADHGFFRSHRAELIALARVRGLHRTDESYEAELDDGQRARVSRRNVADFKRALGI